MRATFDDVLWGLTKTRLDSLQAELGQLAGKPAPEQGRYLDALRDANQDHLQTEELSLRTTREAFDEFKNGGGAWRRFKRFLGFGKKSEAEFKTMISDAEERIRAGKLIDLRVRIQSTDASDSSLGTSLTQWTVQVTTLRERATRATELSKTDPAAAVAVLRGVAVLARGLVADLSKDQSLGASIVAGLRKEIKTLQPSLTGKTETAALADIRSSLKELSKEPEGEAGLQNATAQLEGYLAALARALDAQVSGFLGKSAAQWQQELDGVLAEGEGKLKGSDFPGMASALKRLGGLLSNLKGELQSDWGIVAGVATESITGGLESGSGALVTALKNSLAAMKGEVGAEAASLQLGLAGADRWVTELLRKDPKWASIGYSALETRRDAIVNAGEELEEAAELFGTFARGARSLVASVVKIEGLEKEQTSLSGELKSVEAQKGPAEQAEVSARSLRDSSELSSKQSANTLGSKRLQLDTAQQRVDLETRAGNFKSVTVRKNETMSDLVRRAFFGFGTSLSQNDLHEIVQHNESKLASTISSFIQNGTLSTKNKLDAATQAVDTASQTVQQLTQELSRASSQLVVAEASAKPTTSAVTHTVVTGDTLGALTGRYLGDSSLYMQVARDNGISDSDEIGVGHTIRFDVTSNSSAGSAAVVTASALVSSINSRLSQAKERLQSAKTDRTEAQNKLNSLTTNYYSGGSIPQGMTLSLEVTGKNPPFYLVNSLNTAQAEYDAQKTQHDRQSIRTTEAESKWLSASEHLKGIKTKASSLRTKIAGNQEKLTTLQATMAGLAGIVQSLDSALKEMAQFDASVSSLIAANDLATPIFGASSPAQAKAALGRVLGRAGANASDLAAIETYLAKVESTATGADRILQGTLAATLKAIKAGRGQLWTGSGLPPQ